MDGVWGAERVYLALSSRTSPSLSPLPRALYALSPTPPSFVTRPFRFAWHTQWELSARAPDAAFWLRAGKRMNTAELGEPGWGGRNTVWLNATLPPPNALTSLLIHTYTDGVHKTSAIRPDHGTRRKNKPKQTSVPIMPVPGQLNWSVTEPGYICVLFISSSGPPGTRPMRNFKTWPSETWVRKLMHSEGEPVCLFETIKPFHAPLTNQSRETCGCVM